MVLGGHFEFLHTFFIFYFSNLIGLIYWPQNIILEPFFYYCCHWKLRYKLIIGLPHANYAN